MASIVLGSIGSAVGTAVGGPVGATIGQRAGQLVAGFAENAVSGRGTRKRHIEGARLEDLAVQTSTYGKVIPSIYGTARVAGNILWSRPIKELQTTTTTTTRSGGKGGGVGGGGATQTTTETSYSYFATMAIAVCEGPIASIDRIWADAKLLSLGQYSIRIYYGSETQLPDALIESYEGETTAHRGLAYVVIEDFPLADFGNRIPNFTFEVTRRVPNAASTGLSAEQRVTSVMLIPGSGEYVYDTVVQNKIVGEDVGGQWVQRGNQVTLNMHNVQNIANVNLALDQLQNTFPNLEYVGVVVNWFASSLDAATAVVEPCVEYPATTRVVPNEWQVAGRTRATARVIGYDGDMPRYGGTPSDASIMRLLQALNARGLKVFFYPMMLVDVAGKPWRGEMSCASSAVVNFFNKSDGYNSFIMHYAQLVTGWVHAFAIGSELKGLTAITSSAGVYPAVDQLINLAAAVQAVMPFAKITYAADWSEYHHTDGGWYHLDALWASPYIDFIGIDAYFPLTDGPQDSIDKQTIRDGWTSGEGYDWYYTDVARTTKASLSAAYAWKNIAWWWNNYHVNPNGSTTGWTPQAKKIWFTEYGFASVDGTTNQPNVFVDPTASSSALPRFSKGRVDFSIQRAAIEATEEVWADSAMVEERFLWTWDARPYPQWPDLLTIWSDGVNWDTGHWVQGKLGLAQLGGAVRILLERAGLHPDQIDCSELTDTLDGFVLYQRGSVREALEQLMMAFPFDIVETEGILKAVKRGKPITLSFDADRCLPVVEGEQRVTIEMRREQEFDLPAEVEIIYLNRLNGYNAGAQRAFKMGADARGKHALKLSVVLSDQQAKVIAERTMAARWMERNRFAFQLPIAYAALEPGDVVQCENGLTQYTMRIEAIQFGKPGIVRIEAVEEDPSLYESYIPPASVSVGPLVPDIVSPTLFEVLDMPALPSDDAQVARVRFGAVGLSGRWPGASVYQLRSSGDVLLTRVPTAAVMGNALTVLEAADAQRIDYAHVVDVSLIGQGMLANASLADVLDGANSALLGNEIIQFMTAEPLAQGKYRLGGLLRGRLGTEEQVSEHAAGERFILLDGNLASYAVLPDQRGKAMEIAAATFGMTVDADDAITFIPVLRSLKPYAPVHVTGVRDGAGNLVVRWVRRTRLRGEWQDHQDVPLSEVDERYDVDVMNGGVVVRSVRTTTPEFIYSAADQLADFGTVPVTVTLHICQLSALVGRGLLAQAVL